MHIIQDIKIGTYVKMRGFHMLLWTSSPERALKFNNRAEAEAFALETGEEKETVIIPYVKNQQTYSHA